MTESESHVTSLELSRRLWELGWRLNTVYGWVQIYEPVFGGISKPTLEYYVSVEHGSEDFSAPLATELLEVLPETIHYAPKNTKSGKRRRLRLYINKNNCSGYFIFYGINAWNKLVALRYERPWISDLKIDEIGNKSYANICNPLAAMLIKLTEEGIVKPGGE